MPVFGWNSDRRRRPWWPALLLVVLSGVVSPPSWAQQDYAVVIMYHHVGVAEYPSTNVTVKQFRAHMGYLAAHGFHVLPLEDVVRRLQQGRSFPDRAIAITFDDAYESVYSTARPLLERRGWPYTVFVSTDYIDRGYRNYMSWAQMRRAAADGARFANHSRSHPHLPRLQASGSGKVADELHYAQRRLEAELGKAALSDPPLFAFPFGEYDAGVAATVREHGYVAFGQQSGPVGPHSDPRALPRFPFNEHYADVQGFATKVTSRPLPLESVTPWDPVVHSDSAPPMTVKLATAVSHAQDLRCYFRGERETVHWLQPGRRFRVEPSAQLPAGRSRYNCTLVAPGGGYYWYSHLWIKDSGTEGLKD